MEKTLKLYTLVDGVNDTPFPSTEGQIEILDFRYNANRMGGTPTISCSLMHPTCLDDVWNSNVYAIFNGEKYFIKQIPSSSKNSGDSRYKHEIELVSERRILESVYFYEVVVNEQNPTHPKANGTRVSFFGDIRQLASRINESLRYSGIGYNVVIDDGIKSDEQLVDLDGKYLINALQAFYEIFDVPFYFEGKTIHVGYSSSAIPQVFKYGAKESLLSISKQNANSKIINRCSGKGSSDNIPYYYPNNSPKGVIRADLETKSNDFKIEVVNYDKFSEKVKLDGVVKSASVENTIRYFELSVNDETAEGEKVFTQVGKSGSGAGFQLGISAKSQGVLPVKVYGKFWDFEDDDHPGVMLNDLEHEVRIKGTLFYNTRISSREETKKVCDLGLINGDTFYCPISKTGNYIVSFSICVIFKGKYSTWNRVRYKYSASYKIENYKGWDIDGKAVRLEDIGIKGTGTPELGDTIKQTLVKYINPSDHLLPPIYRETGGDETFYNALNGTYPIPDDKDGNTYNFKNPYVVGNAKEHIIEVPDIKPTIENVVNAEGLPIDMFLEFAYDKDDNDETEEIDGKIVYKHPYFFGKLRKFDGKDGFNLFDSASEQGEMKVVMNTGDSGACEFIIGVSKDEHQYNLVQVDWNTNIPIRDENGNILCGREDYQPMVEMQEWQQDTRKREVWIALKKDFDTYGILMPQKEYRPKGKYYYDESNTLKERADSDVDRFVLLNINLPKAYITNAEERLKEEIIRYMYDYNDDVFNFSIDFSRIYLAENPTIEELLDENSRITIEYNGKRYPLFVKSFSYDMKHSEPLPNIRVELSETLETPQNPIDRAAEQVERKVGRTLANIDVVGSASPYFMRKDIDDTVSGKPNFLKGINFGERGGVSVNEKHETSAVFDYIFVKKKATLTSLEIQKKTHVGGQQLITPASILCNFVEEFETYYRCYFEKNGDGKQEIFNTFAVDDQAICQTFNDTFSKYYWRLVIGVGEDYIDLSKTDCDENSDIPELGDAIIQLGNRTIEERQNAIVLSSFGQESPSFTQYKGINSYTLLGKEVTRLSPYGNLLQGKVKIESGSVGAANIEDLETGGSNMLRNSGFTGDYLSAQLNGETGLDGNSPMFSPSFDHWDAVGVEATDSVESLSKKEVVFTNGSLRQEMPQQTILGESYVLSFRAKGTSATFIVGGRNKVVTFTNEYKKYVEKFVATANDATFIIESLDATICDLQLERGTVVSGWSNNYMDNQSELAYYESIKYVSDAIQKGDTNILGGLILSNMIMLGKRNAEGKFENTSGMSGVYNDKNDIAYYAGGDYDMAIKTVMKYANNPQYKPTDDEVKSMVNFVITHGGRAILNDAIVRGTIYAKNGEFTGIVHAKDGDFTGMVNASSGTIGNFTIDNGWLHAEVQALAYDMYSDLSSGLLQFLNKQYELFFNTSTGRQERKKDKYGKEIVFGQKNVSMMGGVSALSRRDHCFFAYNDIPSNEDKIGFYADVFNGKKENYAFYAPHGQFAGLRPKLRVIKYNEETLDEFDYNVICAFDNVRLTLNLQPNPEEGQTINIWKQGNHILTVNGGGNKIVDMGNSAANTAILGSAFYGKIELLFHANEWYMVLSNNKR